MKQTLSLKLGQQLTMTPQLQQAIRLLQLSCLDLRQEIQDALEGNPMLELDEEDGGDEPTGSPAEADRAESDGDDDLDGVDATLEGDVIDDLPVDTSWDEIYQPAPAPAPAAGDSESWDFETRNAPEETLQDHLLWQLNLTPMSDSDRVIAMAIIDTISPDGMLTTPVEELVTSLDGVVDEEAEIAHAEVMAVLKQIQHFDPIGVGARDLGECLRIQLEQLPAGTPWLAESLTLVNEHLPLLASRDFAALKRRTKLGEEELGEVVRLIQTLNPRPGTTVAQEAAEYVVPDVMVSRKEGRWLVELNPDATPGLRINAGYAGLVKRADNSADNTFLRDHLQEARWFLKSLQSRNETLLKVATRIVEHQRGFLEYGEEAMKPLVLNEIAEAVEMHESTISRVTSRKYMHTPRGIFELKYFFSSHVSTSSGGEVSSTAIRALIKKLTADENPRKPLSDSRIATILAEQNINVARRTVAKYRESMAIPPSNERKRLV
jgi:RNA polymerase sigma-54 factor